MPDTPETHNRTGETAELRSARNESRSASHSPSQPAEAWAGGDPLWRTMLDALPIGIGVLEAESGRTLWINASLKSLLDEGTGQSNVIGKPPSRYLPALDSFDWNQTFASLLEPPYTRNASAPQRLQFPHHSTRVIAYWEWSLRPLDETSPPRYIMLTIQSVSDAVMNERLLKSAGRVADRARRRAEALVQLTQLVNASFTTCDLLQTVTDQAAAFFDAHYAAVLLLRPDDRFEIGYSMGLDAAAVGCKPGSELSRHNTLGGKAIAARQTLVVRDTADEQIAMPTLVGAIRPSALVSSPIWRGDHNYGVVEVYFTESRDIPEDARSLLAAFADQTAIALHKADLYDEIAEQRRRLQSIFNNAPVSIVYMQTDGKILAANTAAAAKYGQPPEALVGSICSDHLTDVPAGLLEQVCDGAPFHASHHIYQAPTGDERVCDMSVLPVRDESERVTGVLLLSFDVTDLVAAQQEADAARRDAEGLLHQVRATQTQMVQVEKMRAIGELASGVAHDFNNALQAILGYTELSMDSLDDPDELRSHLAIITKAAQDAKTTVMRLQRFAKQRAVTDGDPTDVNAIVKDVVDLTRPNWRDAAQREGHAYDIQLDLQPVPKIVAEPSGLREVLINMVYNALNAMPNGGRIRLSTRMYGADQVEIEIADTGIGMTPEVMGRIFDPFFTTRGVEGNGLGLAVSWTIIQRHGGTIQVESEPGHGTIFFLRLPIREGAHTLRREPTLPPPAPTYAASILVVDDEIFVSSILTTILSRQGYYVTTVNNAAEALDKLTAEGAHFDLVLTDHGMPGMNGLQLTAETKRRWPDLPVLLLTGWGESLLQTHVTETLPDAVLGKPINQTDLLNAVSSTLRKKNEVA